MNINYTLDLSPRGLEFIAGLEGFSAHWYLCPAGKTTIGYGHVRKGEEIITEPITEAYAKALLRHDAALAAGAVREAVTVALNQHQFDALASLAFNIGAGAFERSTLLKLLNVGSELMAADEFLRWVFAGKARNQGLEHRRAAERRLFLEGVYS